MVSDQEFFILMSCAIGIPVLIMIHGLYGISKATIKNPRNAPFHIIRTIPPFSPLVAKGYQLCVMTEKANNLKEIVLSLFTEQNEWIADYYTHQVLFNNPYMKIKTKCMNYLTNRAHMKDLLRIVDQQDKEILRFENIFGVRLDKNSCAIDDKGIRYSIIKEKGHLDFFDSISQNPALRIVVTEKRFKVNSFYIARRSDLDLETTALLSYIVILGRNRI